MNQLSFELRSGIVRDSLYLLGLLNKDHLKHIKNDEGESLYTLVRNEIKVLNSLK